MRDPLCRWPQCEGAQWWLSVDGAPLTSEIWWVLRVGWTPRVCEEHVTWRRRQFDGLTIMKVVVKFWLTTTSLALWCSGQLTCLSPDTKGGGATPPFTVVSYLGMQWTMQGAISSCFALLLCSSNDLMSTLWCLLVVKRKGISMCFSWQGITQGYHLSVLQNTACLLLCKWGFILTIAWLINNMLSSA